MELEGFEELFHDKLIKEEIQLMDKEKVVLQKHENRSKKDNKIIRESGLFFSLSIPFDFLQFLQFVEVYLRVKFRTDVDVEK